MKYQSHTIFYTMTTLTLDEYTIIISWARLIFHNSQLEYEIQSKYLVNLNSQISDLIQTEKITNLVEELMEA